jgi:hypothetical protein
MGTATALGGKEGLKKAEKYQAVLTSGSPGLPKPWAKVIAIMTEW